MDGLVCGRVCFFSFVLSPYLFFVFVFCFVFKHRCWEIGVDNGIILDLGLLAGHATEGAVSDRSRPPQDLRGGGHQARQYMYKFQHANSHQASSGDMAQRSMEGARNP